MTKSLAPTVVQKPSRRPDVLTPTLPREMTYIPAPPPVPLVHREEVVKAASALDGDIKKRATKTVAAMLRYRDSDTSDMTAEERAIAQDASLPDKETPFAAKVALRIFESYQKQEGETSRPALALTINMFGSVQHNYETVKVTK